MGAKLAPMSDDSTTMTSHRPYLLRALYEWIADNGMTPHLLVDATRPHVQVPTHAVKDGRIVLNVAERAVAGKLKGHPAGDLLGDGVDGNDVPNLGFFPYENDPPSGFDNAKGQQKP